MNPTTSSDAPVIGTPTDLDLGSEWGTRLEGLIDKAIEGKDPYASPEPEVTPQDEPAEEKETPTSEDTAETKEESSEKEPEEKETPTSEEDDKFKTPKNLTEKAAAKWGELRAEAKQAATLAREVEILKAELEKAKTDVTQVDTAEIDRLKKINAEYESELAVSRVEATQDYKTQVIVPMENLVDLLNVYAERYSLNTREMIAAFAESDPAKQGEVLTEMASQLPERDRLRFYDAADKYSEIIKKSESFKTAARERASELEQTRQSAIEKEKAESERKTSEARAVYEKAVTKTFEDLKKSVPLLSDAKIAAEVQRLAKGDYTNADPELKAYLAHSGALLPHLLSSFKELQTSLEKANNTIASYRNGSPKAGAGQTETSRGVAPDLGFLEAIEAQVG